MRFDKLIPVYKLLLLKQRARTQLRCELARIVNASCKSTKRNWRCSLRCRFAGRIGEWKRKTTHYKHGTVQRQTQRGAMMLHSDTRAGV